MSDIIDRTPPCVTVLINEIDRTVLDHFDIEPGTTVQQWVDEFGYDIYTSPFAFFFNSAPLAEIDWETTTFEEGDVLTLVGQPGYVAIGLVVFWVGFALAVASASYALYTILTMEQYDPSDEAASPNYSISYRGNQQRRDKPRPVVYGEIRTFPDSIGYYKHYVNHDQWMYQLFEVTLGETEQITEADCYYEETPLTNFVEYTFEYLPPGTDSQVFPFDQVVSSEVQGLEISDSGPTTAYVVCGAGEVASSVTFDVSMPQGFYRVDSEGDLEWQSLSIALEIRKIDDAGNPLTGWGAQLVTMVSNDIHPIRQTYVVTPAQFGETNGRFEARITRGTPVNNNTNIMDMFVWDALRATLITESSDTLSTRIAIAVRQSEKVGNLALSKFNVKVKRRIRAWEGHLAHTKSAALAFVDAVTADYGGNMPDTRLDIDGLMALDNENREHSEFSGIYDTGIDLWKVLTEMARCYLGAAVELPGGKLTIIPDDENVTPMMLIGQDRIVKDSFKMEQKSLLSLDYDYVVCTFKDAAEDYRENTVDCVPFGSPKLNPKNLVLRGPTTRDAAWNVGIRLINEMKWRRTAISFNVGLEGLIPTYGDTIRVAHYMLDIMGSPRGYSGAIKSASSSQLVVYEDLSSLIGTGGLKVFTRDASAAPLGPYDATVYDAHTITANTNISGLQFADDIPRPTFAIGGGSDFITTVKVNRVTPVSEHVIEIGGFEDNQNVYIEDSPPTFENLPPPENLSPQVINLNGEMHGDTGKARVRLTWVGLYSDYYVIDISTDDKVTWDRISRTNDEFFEGIVPQSSIWMRVIGVGLVFGTPAEIGFNVGDYNLSLPQLLGFRASGPFLADSTTVQWERPPNDHRVLVEVHWNGKLQRWRVYDRGVTSATYTREAAMQDDSISVDGLQWPAIGGRDQTFKAYMVNMADELGPPNLVALQNPQCDYLIAARYEERHADLFITFTPPDDDYFGVDIHISETAGFTPDLSEGSATRVYRGRDTNIIIAGILEPITRYHLLMAGYDIWGATDDLNWSQETIIDTADDSTSGPIDWGDIINTPFDPDPIPEQPTGLTVFATPWYHHISWDLPTPSGNFIISYGEVWAASVNDRGQATLVGQGLTAFSMPVDPLDTLYYWVRFMSYAGTPGPWSNGQFNGVEGVSPPDPGVLLEILTGQITEGELYQDLNDRIDGIEVNSGDIDGIGQKYTVKIGVDGHVAGFGLINTGNEFDEVGGHSQFGVSADTFWVGSPGTDSFAFIVDAVNNRVVMDGAFIKNATITSAAIGNAAIDTVHIGDGTITNAKIENGAVSNLKIGQTIQSYTFDPNQGIGWKIDKNGEMELAQLTIYDHNGDVLLQSGQSDSTINDKYAGTVTGNDNLLLDGQFESSRGDGSLTGYWYTDGCQYQYTTSRGPYARLLGGRDATMYPASGNPDRYIPCGAGEWLYGSLTSLVSGSASNSLVMMMIFYNGDGSDIGQYPFLVSARPSTQSSGSFQDQSGGVKVPSGAAYCTAALVNYSNTEADVLSVKLIRAPAQVSPDVASTYIKSAAIDTLMVADQAIVHPRYWVTTASQGAWGSWVEILSSGSFTASSYDVPLGITVTVNPTQTVGGTSTVGSFRVLRNGSDRSGTIRIWYTSGGGVTEPGSNDITFIDTSHGGGSMTYTVQILGDANQIAMQHCTMTIYEMKR